MDATQFAELQTQFEALKQENAALKSAGEQTEAGRVALAERLAAVEKERQTERFTSLIKNDGQRWFGENQAHLGILGTLAQTFGEDSKEFGDYVAQQKAVATALRQSAAFNELGGDGQGQPATGEAKLEQMARERAAAKNISIPQAYTEVLNENPALYSA